MAVIQQYHKEEEKDEGSDPRMILRTTYILDTPQGNPDALPLDLNHPRAFER